MDEQQCTRQEKPEGFRSHPDGLRYYADDFDKYRMAADSDMTGAMRRSAADVESLRAQLFEAQSEAHAWRMQAERTLAEREDLQARLAEIERQEPVAWSVREKHRRFVTESKLRADMYAELGREIVPLYASQGAQTVPYPIGEVFAEDETSAMIVKTRSDMNIGTGALVYGEPASQPVADVLPASDEVCPICNGMFPICEFNILAMVHEPCGTLIKEWRDDPEQKCVVCGAPPVAQVAQGVSDDVVRDAEFSVILHPDTDDALIVAGTSGSRERALSEAMAYAMQYTDEGAVAVTETVVIAMLAAQQQNDWGAA